MTLRWRRLSRTQKNRPLDDEGYRNYRERQQRPHHDAACGKDTAHNQSLLFPSQAWSLMNWGTQTGSLGWLKITIQCIEPDPGANVKVL